jgi:hypothetical protein
MDLFIKFPFQKSGISASLERSLIVVLLTIENNNAAPTTKIATARRSVWFYIN